MTPGLALDCAVKLAGFTLMTSLASSASFCTKVSRAASLEGLYFSYKQQPVDVVIKAQSSNDDTFVGTLSERWVRHFVA